MAKYSVAYTVTCVSSYEEVVEADSEEEAIALVESQSINLDMDEQDHDCGSPVVTHIEKGEEISKWK